MLRQLNLVSSAFTSFSDAVALKRIRKQSGIGGEREGEGRGGAGQERKEKEGGEGKGRVCGGMR